MILRRRRVLQASLGALAGLALRPLPAMAATTRDISMAGTANGSRVWFDPLGLLVEPGQTLRWTNRDPGNSHTVTSYHPDIESRPMRIPEGAEPWDSGYLLPGDTFSVTLLVEGVYDYYCVPHEHAGMVGRIVVGRPGESGAAAALDNSLPEIALLSFPSVEAILAEGEIRPPAPR